MKKKQSMVWVCKGSGKLWDLAHWRQGEPIDGIWVSVRTGGQQGFMDEKSSQYRFQWRGGQIKVIVSLKFQHHWGSSTFWTHDWVELHQMSSHPHCWIPSTSLQCCRQKMHNCFLCNVPMPRTTEKAYCHAHSKEETPKGIPRVTTEHRLKGEFEAERQ